MSMTDPVADMFTRLRNSSRAGHDKVDIPASRVKKEIADILKREGFIKNYRLIEDSKQGILRIYLKYRSGRKETIGDLQRISKPGLRVYAKKEEVPRVLGGVGIAILSTSKGIMTDEECRQKGVGGEVLGYVW
ncbi:30S ribosomal protein S8 [candidate division NPL-UPA2 bacterium]|nr:30S ribosomal protein S8 [candidate division NPL-UPA2 bacterium]